MLPMFVFIFIFIVFLYMLSFLDDTRTQVPPPLRKRVKVEKKNS